MIHSDVEKYMYLNTTLIYFPGEVKSSFVGHLDQGNYSREWVFKEFLPQSTAKIKIIVPLRLLSNFKTQTAGDAILALPCHEMFIWCHQDT